MTVSVWEKVRVAWGAPRQFKSWIRGDEMFVREFVAKAVAEETRARYDDAYLARIDSKVADLTSRWLKLMLFHNVLLIFLIASMLNWKLHANMAGITIDPGSIAREFVLLLAAHCSIAGILLQIRKDTLANIATRVRKERRKEEFVFEHVETAGLFDLFMEMLKGYTRSGFFGLSTFVMTASIAIGFIGFVTATFVAMGLSIGIHVTIMVDIWNHPSVAWGSHIIVCYCAFLDIVTLFLITAVMLPMRYLDFAKVTAARQEVERRNSLASPMQE